MGIAHHLIEYKDKRSLSTELAFLVACERVRGGELISVRPSSAECGTTFRNSATALLRTMKREGVISLFVLESELLSSDKTECTYLLNKYPELSATEPSEYGIYIKI